MVEIITDILMINIFKCQLNIKLKQYPKLNKLHQL